MKKIIAVIAFAILATSNSSAQKASMAGEYKYESECQGVEGDGSQTLKAWGTGNSKNDAVEQAKKNAVRDVLFKGIRNGKPDICNVKPVINEVNAQEKYEDYFNKFFTDDGAYKEFVSMNDEPISITGHGVSDRKRMTDGVQYGVIVQIRRAELKQRMIKDNILPQ
jgi:hypothetical protein